MNLAASVQAVTEDVVLALGRSVHRDTGLTNLVMAPDLRRRVSVVRSSVPAITHVDYSARMQTVDDPYGRFERVQRAFYAKTGCSRRPPLCSERLAETPSAASVTPPRRPAGLGVQSHTPGGI